MERDQLVVVGFDISTSSIGERNALVSMLTEVVVPEAARRRAWLELYPVGGRGFNGVEPAAVVQFQDLNGNDAHDKPRTQQSAQTLVDALVRVWDQHADASDPVGFFRRAANRASRAEHVLVAYLGDARSQVEGCDLSLLPTDQLHREATAAECIEATGGPFSLGGAPVWLGGAGLDLDGALSTERAIAIGKTLAAIVTKAEGVVERPGPDIA